MRTGEPILNIHNSMNTGSHLCYQNKFDQLDVPVLHISGWYDDEQIGTPLNYIGMTSHGAQDAARASQRLLMGPWGHVVNSSNQNWVK